MMDLPTLADLRDCLSDLVKNGLGDLTFQIVVVPDSTLQAIATAMHHSDSRPALMVQLASSSGDRLPVCLISTNAIDSNPISTAEKT